MSKIAVSVSNLHLKYKFVNNMNMKQEIIKVFKRDKNDKRVKEVNALNDVSFDVETGKTVGIIGSNGSGKTTLLKTIAGIYKPDSGIVNTFGNSVSLLTLGAGFQSELSGIDNIYVNGLLLGLSKKGIDKKLYKIVEFADIGEFIDYPIKTYSSGMRTRLAFSIACHIDPQILLIDEVLGVGDETFKKKSESKIKELINENRTVIIVSHNLSVINDICSDALWIHNGKLKQYGPAKEVIRNYKEFINSLKKVWISNEY